MVCSRIFMVVILAGVLSGTTFSRLAEAGNHAVIVGLATTCADITQGWHSDETYPVSALDLVKCSGGTAGASVYYQAYGYSGSLNMDIIDHTWFGAGTCPGADVRAWRTDTGQWLGQENHVQIYPGQGVIGAQFSAGTGWNIFFLGNVAGTRPCPTWTGVHLHQSGRTDGPGLVTHWCCLPDPISPTGDAYANWLHAFQW